MKEVINRERVFHFLYGALRCFHNSLFVIVVLLMGYLAGWMLAGVSGMLLSPLVASLSGQDYSQWFIHSFPTAGKVVGVITGLWFAKTILRKETKRL